ncbi:MAG: filamentous hemagglutinin N-terminal domain-containing protein [Coleofasciculus sp. S288]|nr:filamentous hemagglutinin N-terminal domain-containing protein [Coleofasciculus sp. S288]
MSGITQSRSISGWKLGLVSLVAIGGAIAFSENCALGQIIPDTTLGTENSVVTPLNPQVDQIDGGAIRGANLFHSFEEFNVDEERGAYFTNPGGIENILTRVTGTNASNILGTLGVIGGNANLFLINPNGIIFGEKARLDVGGSFVATTANAVGLTNGDIFSANPGSPLPTGLLNVNPNAFFFNQMAAQPIINRSTADSRGLEVPQEQSLLLVGGDIALEGGRIRVPGARVELGAIAGTGTVGLSVDGNNLRLSFPDGVALSEVSLTNEAEVNVRAGDGGSIAINAQNLNLTGASRLRAGIASGLGSIGSVAGDIDINATGAINLTDESFIANAVLEDAVGKGGDINITTGVLSVTNGTRLTASTYGQGNAGSVNILARETVSLDGESGDGYFDELSGVFSIVGDNTVDSTAKGKGGDINITTGSLSVTNGAQLNVRTYGQGDAGRVNILVRDTVSFDGQSSNGYSSAASSTVAALGVGKGGDINITTGSLSVTNGAQLDTSTVGQGDAGSVNINARDTVWFDGVGSDGFPTKASSIVQTGSADFVANAGGINITTGSLSVTNGAWLDVSTFGRGNAGSVNINARDNVSFEGLSSNGYISGVYSAVDESALGKGGNINVTARSLSVRNEARLDASTEGEGDGGNITLNVNTFEAVNGGKVVTISNGTSSKAGNITVNATDSVTLTGSDPTYFARLAEFRDKYGDDVAFFLLEPGPASGLFTNTANIFDNTLIGQGGDLKITTGQLFIRDGAQVSVSSSGPGNAGNLTVVADSIWLDNQGKLTGTTVSGIGGNTRLQVQDLILMRNESAIATTAENNGSGGNITINAPFIVAVSEENSDIVANADQGSGGRITINADAIFGLEYRPKLTPLSDINASSNVEGLDGIVELNTPDIDPSRGLTNLPTQPVDTEVTQSCSVSGSQNRSEFVLTGRGGLPPTPREALGINPVEVEWVSLNSESENPSGSAMSANPNRSTPTRIVEAQGWVRGVNGEIMLVATAPTVTPHGSWLPPTVCRASH